MVRIQHPHGPDTKAVGSCPRAYYFFRRTAQIKLERLLMIAAMATKVASFQVLTERLLSPESPRVHFMFLHCKPVAHHRCARAGLHHMQRTHG